MAGVPCDLDVTGACVAPLTCELTGNPVMGGLSSQCTSSGAGDPYACDPMRPMCPNNFRCVEVEPGVYRCRP